MTHNLKKIFLKQKGFSLIEIMVVLTIMTILIFAVSDFLIRGFKSNVFGYEQDEAVNSARKAANKIAKELREAMTSATGTYMLNTVATNTIIFFADIDNNTSADRIRYYIENTDLKRGITTPTGTPLSYNLANEKTSVVANYLNNKTLPIFTYYDASSTLIANPTANVSKIRLVHILMKINVTPERAPADFFYETDVQIRNLKDNL